MNAKNRYFLSFLVLAACSFSLHAADLLVRGEVKTELRLDLADIKSLPLIKISAREHDGTMAAYEGVALSEILRRAGVPQGDALRGNALQLCVLVRAADGYQAVFSLAELDPGMTDKIALLVFRRDGRDLDATAGPLRIVVPGEKRQARCVRQVRELEIIRVASRGEPPQDGPRKHP